LDFGSNSRAGRRTAASAAAFIAVSAMPRSRAGYEQQVETIVPELADDGDQSPR
jgi:hypothetical protein